MNVGTVFRWDQFPFPKFSSEEKPRWFIYLGKSSIFETPIFAYMCTTTSKTQYYKIGGSRDSNPHIIFRSGEYGFIEDCILDLKTGFYSQITLKQLETNPDIEIKDVLCEVMLRRIYKLILSTQFIPRKIKNDIHDCYNLDGITGLKRP